MAWHAGFPQRRGEYVGIGWLDPKGPKMKRRLLRAFADACTNMLGIAGWTAAAESAELSVVWPMIGASHKGKFFAAYRHTPGLMCRSG